MTQDRLNPVPKPVRRVSYMSLTKTVGFVAGTTLAIGGAAFGDRQQLRAQSR
jgi:hypothetical protein